MKEFNVKVDKQTIQVTYKHYKVAYDVKTDTISCPSHLVPLGTLENMIELIKDIIAIGAEE